jgi:hypothetical protein
MSVERSPVSDSRRPQFLPPEEPPPPAPEPPSSPRPGGNGPLIVAAIGVALLVLAGISVLLYQSGPSGHYAATSPDTTPGPSAPRWSEPAYTTLPDPCKAPGDTVPADVRSGAPHRFADSCRWEILRTDRARSLTIGLTLEKDDPASGSAAAKAAMGFADDIAYAGDSARNGGFESTPEHLSGLGEEAFAARSYNLIQAGPTKQTATSYDMGGALVEARSRNVLVTVRLQGADYPPSVRRDKKLVGTRLGYSPAKQHAIAMLAAVLAKLR